MDLVDEQAIGGLAPRVFTLMGYIPVWRPLVEETAPAIAGGLAADKPDLVIYAPV
jgi:hypothetical protein